MEFKENNYEKLVELFNLFGADKKDWDVFLAADYPIPYKTLTIYPVQVDLYKYFHMLVSCLVQPHLTSGDIKAISMSYLDFLVYLQQEKRMPILSGLVELLLVCLRLPRQYTKADGKTDDSIMLVEGEDKKWRISIQGELFDGKDFDFIREIICTQNALELPDEKTHPDIVQAYKDVEEYRRKQAHIKMCSFEDQLNIIVAKSGYTRAECMKMTIRSFSRLLERIDKIMNYEIMSLLKPNMKPEDQKNVPHYAEASKTQEEKLRDSLIDQESQNNKITQA